MRNLAEERVNCLAQQEKRLCMLQTESVRYLTCAGRPAMFVAQRFRGGYLSKNQRRSLKSGPNLDKMMAWPYRFLSKKASFIGNFP